MPFNIDQVDQHKKGLDAKGKKQWVAVANSVYDKCMADGGTDATCAPKAIRQANGTAAHNAAYAHYELGASGYSIRYETLRGRRHLVVPVIMMREGVHSGSHGPLLHRSADLGKFPPSWNGIPITVPHPTDGDGGHISANSPGVIDSQVVGAVFNTIMDGGSLKAEAWLDEQALQRISPVALQHIEDGLPLDVSVGVFTEDQETPGDWNGEHYEGVATNHRPDHLALLPGGRGACSWEDGCGVRVNEELLANQVGRLRYDGTETDPWTDPNLADFGVSGNWKDLADSDRAMIAAHYLVGTSGAKTFGDLKLPVVNPKTRKLSRDALRSVMAGRGMEVQGITARDKQAAQRMANRLLGSEFNEEKVVTMEELELDTYAWSDAAREASLAARQAKGRGNLHKAAKAATESASKATSNAKMFDKASYHSAAADAHSAAADAHFKALQSGMGGSREAMRSHREAAGSHRRAEGRLRSLGRNSEGGANVKSLQVNAVKYSGTESTAWKKPGLSDFDVGDGQWGDLSAADKSKVANHYLVGTGDAADFSELKFPVVNPKTGKLNEGALRAVISGRGAQANIPAEARVAARKSAYRLLNDEFGAELQVPNTLSELAKELAGEGLILEVNEMSFDDVSEKVRRLVDMMDSAIKIHYVVDVFPDYFIYKVKPREGMGSMMPGMEDGNCPMFQQKYKMNGDSLELEGDPVQVVRKVDYVTQAAGDQAPTADKFPAPKAGEKYKAFVARCMGDQSIQHLPQTGRMKKCAAQWSSKNTQGGQNNMADNTQPCCAEKVEMIIQDDRTRFGEEHREWLLTLEEGQLNLLSPADSSQINREQAVQVLSDTLGDQAKLMAILPPQTKAAISHGLKLYEAERGHKIDHILANTNEGVYTREELAGMDAAALDKLARSIKAPVDYSGMLPADQPQTYGSAGEIMLPPGV